MAECRAQQWRELGCRHEGEAKNVSLEAYRKYIGIAGVRGMAVAKRKALKTTMGRVDGDDDGRHYEGMSPQEAAAWEAAYYEYCIGLGSDVGSPW